MATSKKKIAKGTKSVKAAKKTPRPASKAAKLKKPLATKVILPTPTSGSV